MSFKENKYHIRIPDDLREPCLWIYIPMVPGSPYTAREVEHQYRCALYLLNTICPDMAPNTPTYTILDLGGGSTQTVFEPMSASEGHLEKADTNTSYFSADGTTFYTGAHTQATA